MKHFLLSFTILSMLLPLPVFADTFEASSKLKSAIVYTGRATLKREAIIHIPAGMNTIVFNDLPATLLPESLRAEGKAAEKVIIGAISSKVISSAELAAPRENELNDQLLTLQDQLRTIEAEKQALSDKKNFLANLAIQGSLRTQEEIAEINLKPEQWASAAKTVYTETADTLKAILAQDTASRAINLQIAKIESELARIRTGQRNSYQISLPVESSTPTTLTLELSYQIPGPSWAPLYDARLDTKTGKLDLIQYGSVQQTSGEDWSDISLTLSTAQPQRGTGLPELSPMWLSLFEQVLPADKLASFSKMEMARGGNAPMAAMAPAFDREDSSALKEKNADYVVASIETGGFVSEYRIPGPSNVKADGSASKVMIGTFANENNLKIEIKPQISSDAYLVSTATLRGEAPILPGAINLFRDGAYIGQSTLPLLRPGEAQDLAFGIDDQVSVKRRVMKDERGEAGVISRDNTLERHFVTEIQNLHSIPVKISVLETAPSSQDQDIKSEIVSDKTTPGYKKDVRNIKGLLEWTLDMQQKQKSEVRLGWKVSWPKEKNLSGL